ncbi:50S ribosomal protein L1 [Candidatus Anstonella stagnisolia]|nr:50S ribosomal protein L1 [Candidatus Anstonella stagnisolia]
MDRKTIITALNKALEDKGKRKFAQSVEFIINFRGINFSKPENRLNLDIILPKGKGKEQKVAVFADGQIALEAKNAGIAPSDIIDAAGIAKLVADKGKLSLMAKEYEFLAQPSLMMAVGKSLGQRLGSKGKLPKPIAGISTIEAIKQAKNRVRLTSRGKYLPVVQCKIGSENMSVDELADNFEFTYDKVKAQTTEPAIKSVYVKLSMGKTVKVEAAKTA